MQQTELLNKLDDGGNKNSACKAYHVIHYIQQWLNRRHKALVPKNKQKEAEFPYMLEGKLYLGTWLLKKNQNMEKLLD